MKALSYIIASLILAGIVWLGYTFVVAPAFGLPVAGFWVTWVTFVIVKATIGYLLPKR